MCDESLYIWNHFPFHTIDSISFCSIRIHLTWTNNNIVSENTCKHIMYSCGIWMNVCGWMNGLSVEWKWIKLLYTFFLRIHKYIMKLITYSFFFPFLIYYKPFWIIYIVAIIVFSYIENTYDDTICNQSIVNVFNNMILFITNRMDSWKELWETTPGY